MNFYIVEDDLAVINNLEDIIESNNLGTICGSSGKEAPNEQEIIALHPDILLIDYLMPEKDGIQVLQALRKQGCHAKCIMISQISSNELIEKAYEGGIDFFIRKPINIIEVKKIIENVSKQIQTDRTLSIIRKALQTEQVDVQDSEDEKNHYFHKLQYILNELGMSGEKGSNDILKVCVYLYENHLFISQVSIGQLCETLSSNPKNMEQRVRRAIAKGMSNIANVGIEDFMNDTFARYSGSLFPFEEIKTEMDYIRKKRMRGGKVNIKKFIDGLLVFMDQ